jgi:pimeloyl-ACP methyl ester carboxylesterase
LQPVVGSVVVAMPGYGVPRAGRAPVDPGSLGAALVRRLDDLGMTEVVLLGHSASCQIVAEAAARDPGRVAGLVLVGPTTDPRGAGWPGLAARWLRTAVRERPGQVPVLLRDYHRTGLADMARAMDAARRHRIERVLPAVRCPVLALRGRHDRIAPHDWVAALARQTADGHAVTLPVGAHMLPITHPAALAARIEDFLLGLPRSRPAPP